MIRKYGGDWQNIATNLTVQRMNAWGFSGFGKWASEAGNLPILPVLEPYNVPIIAVHPDIFDPAVQGDLQSTLRQQIAASVNDSRILGWSFGNEYDDLITPAEVQTILDLGSTVPAKRALMNQALSAIYGNNVANMAAAWGVKATTIAGLYSASPTPPAADIETLREYYEDQYFGFVYQAIKEHRSESLVFRHLDRPRLVGECDRLATERRARRCDRL